MSRKSQRDLFQRWSVIPVLATVFVVGAAARVYSQAGSVDCTLCEFQDSGCFRGCTDGNFGYLCGQDAQGNNVYCAAASNQHDGYWIYKCNGEGTDSQHDCIGGNNQQCAQARYFQNSGCNVYVGTMAAMMIGCSTQQPGCGT